MSKPTYVGAHELDQAEKRVEQFLRHLGFASVIHEPNGNIPPDFLVDSRIAVEVRRLNQQSELKGEGLEELQIPLRRKVEKLLASMGAPNRGSSWFISYRFRRPLGWKTVERRLQAFLRKFKDGPQTANVDEALTRTFSVSLIRAYQPQDKLFVLGGYVDRESGGWLLSEMQRNIQICVNEKTTKIAPYRELYREWWLVLVDHIGFGFHGLEAELFVEKVHVMHDWQRVSVVSRTEPLRYVDLLSVAAG